MVWFNAFQIVALFAALPFIIHWLSSASFWSAQAAFWVALVVYLIAFILHIAAVADLIEKK